MTAPLDIHSLAGPYALDALDDLERELFEEHIIACESCAAEVAELCETAARLSDETWAAPPARLRGAVLERIRNTRQAFPPLRPPTRRDPALRWRHRTRTLVAAGVAAIVAAAGVYVVQELRLREQRIAAQQETNRIESVLAAPDATLRSAQVQGGGRVTVVTSASRDEAVVVLADAKDPGVNKAYQLWLIEGSTPKSAGVLAAEQINATRLITGVKGMNVLGLTIEPAGGSKAPTQPIVAQVPLT
ncbi:MAG TPA: anti-sigma factor [Micromonosporaceae bacterium]|nr:anti-sigma factor [Micromonosporaceae bacterium]